MRKLRFFIATPFLMLGLGLLIASLPLLAFAAAIVDDATASKATAWMRRAKP